MTDSDCDLLPLEHALAPYVDRFVNMLYPQNSKYRHIVLIIHLLHICVIFGLTLLLLLPSKFQLIVTLIYFLLSVSWKIFNGCIITKCSNYLSGMSGDFIPLNWDYLSFLMIFLSLSFYLVPTISPFNTVLVITKILERSTLFT